MIAVGLDLVELVPRAVEALPHIAGERRAHRAAVVARRLEARAHARRIVLVEQEMMDDVGSGELLVLGEIACLAGGGGEGRAPFVAMALDGARHQRYAVAHFEQPRHVLGPLDIARHPVTAMRRCGPACASVLQHPGVFRAPALARIDDERAVLERDPGQAAGCDADAIPGEHEGPQIDMARRHAGIR